jgi:hypothetical protein
MIIYENYVLIERGICLPTICLWVLFIYVEASIRLKDLKHFPAHLDLCRPFAAHCIGYPVVTWGFDIKGYISYRIRQVRCVLALMNSIYVLRLNWKT